MPESYTVAVTGTPNSQVSQGGLFDVYPLNVTSHRQVICTLGVNKHAPVYAHADVVYTSWATRARPLIIM